jgi:hypothetical protein
MMNAIRNSSRAIGIMLAFVLILCASGCKSKKKAAEAAAAEKARMEQQEANLKRQQEEEARRKEAEEKARRDAEANAAKTSEPSARLGQYFDAIANSGSITSANSSISEALSLFASPDTPVLIVISESGGMKDYDKPTTIINYLNYLKDQKKNINKVSDLKFDNSGKIIEVELRKN